MLWVNERLDKITAAQADFTVRGMLMDSCLVQALKEALADLIRSDGEPMDEDTSGSDETDDESSDDEFQIPPSYHFNNPPSPSDNNSLEDTDERTANEDDDERAANEDNNDDPQLSLALPNDEEDNDYGPVESGPLMNEVRLVGRKGQKLQTCMMCELKYCLQHPHRSTLRRLVRSV